MLLTQRKIWTTLQKKDPIHVKLTNLIQTHHLPKTRGNNFKLKLLYNIYTQENLYFDKEGLIMIKTAEGLLNGSVTSQYHLLCSLVLWTQYTFILTTRQSKSQLTSLVSRYFYTQGWRTIIQYGVIAQYLWQKQSKRNIHRQRDQNYW